MIVIWMVYYKTIVKSSAISDDTSSVLFEAAVFDYATIRKASRTIGLITDSSQRYEKSLDPELTPVALARILYLLKDIDSGVVVTSGFSDCYNKKFDEIEIDLIQTLLARLLVKIFLKSLSLKH